MDPSPLTLREMCWMLQGKRVHDWGQTGSSLAMTANANRDPRRRRRPYGVADFVPRDLAKEFRVRTGIGLTKTTLHALRPLFEKDNQHGS